MNRPVLDLTRRHFTRVVGDLTVIGTWYGATHEDSEPCIVILPTGRACLVVGHDGVLVRAKPCVVTLSAAFLYQEQDYLLARAQQFSHAMGMGLSKFAVYKMADLLHESLQDLCMMPERPIMETRVVADVTIWEDGKKRTAELTENH